MTKADTLTELDRAHLDDLIAAHPRSIIRVTRGFFDGGESKPFGHVPNDGDGSVVEVAFSLGENLRMMS